MEISDEELYECIIMIIDILEYEERLKYNKNCMHILSQSEHFYNHDVKDKLELELSHIRSINDMKLNYFDIKFSHFFDKENIFDSINKKFQNKILKISKNL
tara:strand:- start:201 stop:503 length:303 start_codon:yes stop_codon:yes gene_type:complete